MKVRHPSQAGMLFAGNHQALEAQIEECFTYKLEPGKLPKLAERGQLLCYKTSGDVTGDFFSVAGYASISFKK